jgi:CHAD domain-containing protein
MKNWEQALADELERRWKLYRRALKRCQRTFSEHWIHCSRIEARRLAAQVDLHRVFVPRQMVEEAQRILKRHLDTFDPLRDAQVQLLLLKREYQDKPGARAIRKLTLKREKHCQRAARRQIRKVKTRRLKRVIEMLVKRLRKRGRDPERRQLDRMAIVGHVETAFTYLVKCREQMQEAHPATIHRTRIAFKKFRYMMEAMRPLLPGMTPRQMAAMKAFQDVMGDLQDTDVFLTRMRKLVAKKRVPAADAAPILRWLARRHVRQAHRCLRRADVIFKFWPLQFAGRKE